MNSSHEFTQMVQDLTRDSIGEAAELKNAFHDELKQKGFSNRNITRMMKPKKKKGSKYFFKN